MSQKKLELLFETISGIWQVHQQKLDVFQSKSSTHKLYKDILL